MTDNLAIWNALSKTDPKHTKPFNRAGGFKGTAVKPIWIIKQLTEQFGPCGVGWGVNQPSFEVVQGDGEILVFCTVSGWHGKPENIVWGVGGDKVLVKRQSGGFHDDEAFKKAFTDAVNNAFKFVGVAADVHMGLFDDDKYVSQAREEFAEQAGPPQKIGETVLGELRRLAEQAVVKEATICGRYGIVGLGELAADKVEEVRAGLQATIDQRRQKPASNGRARPPVPAGELDDDVGF